VTDPVPEDLTEGEPSPPSGSSILPLCAMAWDQLTEPPLRFAPWPYDTAEIDRIRRTLPAPTAGVAIEGALFAARWFLARNRLRETRKEPAKPDPHSELVRVRDAIEGLKEALRAASPQATRHLLDRPSPGAGSPPMRPGDLLYALEHFSHDNRFALRSLPDPAGAGPPEKPSEQRLIYSLWLAWKSAHALDLPARGWPAFRSACIEPLTLPRFRSLGPPWRSERAWQNLLAAAEQRFKGEAN
jgi:hypothetical protein